MRQLLLVCLLVVLFGSAVLFGQSPPVSNYPTVIRLNLPSCTTPDPFGGNGRCYYSGYGLPDTVVPPPGATWNVSQWFLYLGAFRVPKPVPTGFEPKGLWYNPAGNNLLGSLFVCSATHDYCIEEMTIPTPVITTDINAMPVATALASAGFNRHTGGFGLGAAEPELIFPFNVDYIQSRLYAPSNSPTIALVARMSTGNQALLEYSVADVQREQGHPQTVWPYAITPYPYTVSFSSVSYYTPPWVEPLAVAPMRVFGTEKIANTNVVIIHIFLIG